MVICCLAGQGRHAELFDLASITKEAVVLLHLVPVRELGVSNDCQNGIVPRFHCGEPSAAIIGVP